MLSPKPKKILSNLLLIILVGAFCIFLVSASVEASTTYTRTTTEVCNGGTCTMTLYSGIQNVWEDNQWKDVTKARSLKNKGFDIIYLENDGTHDIVAVDFNYTSIDLMFAFDENNLGEYEYEIEDGKMKTKFKIVFNETYEEEVEIEIEEGDILYYNYQGNPFDKEFHIGEHSTTIILQDANSENLEDTHSYENTPDTPEGDNTGLRIRRDAPFRLQPYLKFNISAIPSGVTIIKGDLILTTDFTFSGSNTISVYYVSDQAWSEDTLTYNARPSNDAGAESTADLTDAPSHTPYNWTITDMLNTSFIAGEKNLSMVLKGITGMTSSSYHFESKEAGTVENRPMLIITYDSCTEILANTSFGSYNNISCLSTDLMNQSRNLTQYDTNDCGYTNETFFEYRQTLFCDFCIAPQWVNGSYSSWTTISCLPSGNNNQSRSITQSDSCGELSSSIFYEYRTFGTCEYSGIIYPTQESTLYKNYADYPNASGVYKILYPLRDSMPMNPFFIILMGFLLVAMTGSYYTYLSLTGKERFFNCLLASSFATFIISIFFSLGELITPFHVLIFIGITIISLSLVIFYR